MDPFAPHLELCGSLSAALSRTPPCAGEGWLVGVSGGADSVALLCLLREYRPDVRLVAAHLNHEARGAESDEDARFVEELCAKLGTALRLARLSEVERTFDPHALPRNRSARYRALRLHFFASSVRELKLRGVMLGHHAGDQAETVLLRLLRESGPHGLAGIARETTVSGLRILRPLLGIEPRLLRTYLAARGQPWREDSSNRSPSFARNRAREALAGAPSLASGLIELSKSCFDVRDWNRRNAPVMLAVFSTEWLARLPLPLARESARRWLISQGVPTQDLAPELVERVLQMCADHATPARFDGPGGIRIRRHQGLVSAERLVQ